MDVGHSGMAAVSSLDDPVRARLYQVVGAQSAPIGRDEAAAAAGIGRPLAAYHLDKMVELGLLVATYQRPAGRRGPGAGRPAKLYARSSREFAVTVPPREYELAAQLLAEAIESDRGGQSTASLRAVAREYGRGLATRNRIALTAEDASLGVHAALQEHGFEPSPVAGRGIQLRNCPFHQLASLHRDMVCGMNLALLEGLVEGFGATQLHPGLDPQPGRCCVVIVDDSSPGNAPAERTTGDE